MQAIPNTKRSYKSFLFIFGFVLNACLGSYFSGYKNGEMSLLIVDMKHIYSWTIMETSFYTGLLNALVPIGSILGVFISCNFLWKFGRKNGLIIADIFGIIGSITCIFIGNIPYPQIIGRFLSGVSQGINYQLIPIYINELVPLEISGFMGFFFECLLFFGVLSSYLMGLNIPNDNPNYDVEDNWWRLVFVFPCLACIIRTSVLLFGYQFDTPFSLINLKKEKELEVVMKKIYKDDYIEENLQRIENKLSNYKDVTYREIFTAYRPRVLLGVVLFSSKQLSGINSVISESSTLYASFADSEEIKILTVMNSMIIITAILIAGRITDKFGRRILVLIGSITCSLFLFLIGIFQEFSNNTMNEISAFFNFCFLFCYGISLGPVPWVYQIEILPEKGISIALVVNEILHGLVVFFTPIAVLLIGTSNLYFFYGVSLIICFSYLFLNMIETKGKTYEEIDSEFSYKNKMWKFENKNEEEEENN